MIGLMLYQKIMLRIVNESIQKDPILKKRNDTKAEPEGSKIYDTLDVKMELKLIDLEKLMIKLTDTKPN